MSYDLRGDPFVTPKSQFLWNNSSIPSYNVEPAFYGYDMTGQTDNGYDGNDFGYNDDGYDGAYVP